MKTKIILITFLAVLSVSAWSQRPTISSMKEWGEKPSERLASFFLLSIDMLDNDLDGDWNTPEDVKEMVAASFKGKFIEKDGPSYKFEIDSLSSSPVTVSYTFEGDMIRGIGINCKPGDNFLSCMYQFEEAMKESNRVEYGGQQFRLVDASDGNGFMIRKSEGTRESGRKITRIYTAIPTMGTIVVLFSN
ncbi:hypothetical protein NXY11_15670 [Parabacteroides faecis]|uniref:hypothetical protein n=1 Tax=Parabacteroides faecis TaxID=1217282 RepID=UPI002164601B|nr:hypothetical protein [Parabacteroides faecis]MCS2891752.1 hypothetical protein [Parabacteroides faecis]UVQ44634.1 hypothetical protein NXY11_15670 [Parabacteroides faecis]